MLKSPFRTPTWLPRTGASGRRECAIKVPFGLKGASEVVCTGPGLLAQGCTFLGNAIPKLSPGGWSGGGKRKPPFPQLRWTLASNNRSCTQAPGCHPCLPRGRISCLVCCFPRGGSWGSGSLSLDAGVGVTCGIRSEGVLLLTSPGCRLQLQAPGVAECHKDTGVWNLSKATLDMRPSPLRTPNRKCDPRRLNIRRTEGHPPVRGVGAWFPWTSEAVLILRSERKPCSSALGRSHCQVHRASV